MNADALIEQLPGNRSDADALVEQLLGNRSPVLVVTVPLPDAVAAAVVERLKQEADRHWWINANRSLELADMIVQIGQARGDLRQTALGVMARGDALRMLGRTEEAAQALEHAGRLFQTAGDEVGWARTRIGKLLMSVDLNRVGDALADAQRAREIFTRYEDHDKLLRLDLNTAIVYKSLGEYRHARTLYDSALRAAQSLGQAGEQYLGLLYNSMGLNYHYLGDFHQALACYERARSILAARNETSAVAATELNIAYLAQAQGRYRQALHLLHRVLDLMVAEQLFLDAAFVKRDIVECYLYLNRYAEARDLARQVSAEFRGFGDTYEEALTLLHLAWAEAELADFGAAQAALDAAEPIFASLGATAWMATVRLRRSQIALRQGDHALARREAMATGAYFESEGLVVNHATATLLYGQAALVSGNFGAAAQAGATALRAAQRGNIPALRYSAHLLLGRAAEVEGDCTRAARRYRAAAATVDRVQQSLTITLRPGFLEDKGDALRALLALHLRSGQARRALETLERAKSQVLLGYLANREQLRWAHEDGHSRSLIEELDRLRAEHHWYYRLAHEPRASDDGKPSPLEPREALIEVARREQRMRAITEQLYLDSGDRGVASRICTPSVHDIQQHLSEDTLLVEYYNDGVHLWAFTLDSGTLEVHPLPATVDAVDRLITQLQTNVAGAISAGRHAPAMRSLASLVQRILQRLYAVLMEPFASRIQDRRRLAIVPYGTLHYLPFHLLRAESEYVIERYESVVLPAAGLITQRGAVRAGGARVLAHSWDGRLPQTLEEARMVQRLLSGEVYCEREARRAVLQTQPTQVLHIAAHGEHRLDRPELSYVQLEDGQLYTDDLLQHDLSYELVTLSACETGRANIAAGDEPIGLGRGFLYAGAGALIVSLWRVVDHAALALMEQLYTRLEAGASKSAALRDAQRAIHAADPDLHPAFWGAFQLVGDARPLSGHAPVEP